MHEGLGVYHHTPGGRNPGGGGAKPGGGPTGMPGGGGIPIGGRPISGAMPRPAPRPVGTPWPGPGAMGASCFGSGGGASTLKLMIVSPRRITSPNVRFCSCTGAGTSSSSSSSSTWPSAVSPCATFCFLFGLFACFFVLGFIRRNSSAARQHLPVTYYSTAPGS